MEWKLLEEKEIKKADSRWVLGKHPLLVLEKALNDKRPNEDTYNILIDATGFMEDKLIDFIENSEFQDGDRNCRNPIHNEVTQIVGLAIKFVDSALERKLLAADSVDDWTYQIEKFDTFIKMINKQNLNYTKTAFKALVRSQGTLKARASAYFGESNELNSSTMDLVPKTTSNSKIVVEKYLEESMPLALQFPSGTEMDSNSYKPSEPLGSENIESSKFILGYGIISNSPNVLDSSMVGEVASNMRNMSMTRSVGQLESLKLDLEDQEEKDNLYKNIKEEEEDQEEGDNYDDNEDDYFDGSFSEESDGY